MRKNYFFKSLSLAILSLLLSIQAIAQDFTNGIFVLNEGGAGSNNASVSFISGGTPSVTNNIYATANPSQPPLGDTAQSMSFNGNYAYIVLNISNTVKIVDRTTMQYVATVTGLNNPRYMAFYDGKAYITNWGSGGSTTDDYIAIMDLQTNTITGTIPAAEGVERIVTYNNKLYVAHQGGYGYGNTVSVINPQTNAIETSITVGDVPNDMIVKDGFLHVLCGGKPMWAPTETYGSLVKINLADNAVVSTVPFNNLHPANLEIDDADNIYFTSDADIFKASLANPAAYAQIASISPQGAYGVYGMNLIDNALYVADAGNYVSPGTVYIFNTSGTLQSNYTVGVIPNSFYKAEAALSAPSFDKQELALYPNPTTERFFLTTDKNPDIAVYDVSGKEVLKAKYSETGINISSLPSGIYMVRISDNSVSTIKKLVIR